MNWPTTSTTSYLPPVCGFQHIASQKTHGHHRAEFATDTATGNSATLAGWSTNPPILGRFKGHVRVYNYSWTICGICIPPTSKSWLVVNEVQSHWGTLPIIMVQWKVGYITNTSYLSNTCIFHFHEYGRNSRLPTQTRRFCSGKIIHRNRVSAQWKHLCKKVLTT